MIITNDEQLLRTQCEDVSLDEIGPLINLLENELSYANKLGVGGIGLAAIQVGVLKNIAIVRLKDFNINLINCKIEKSYDSAVFKDEGCLSLPGKIGDTIRFQEVYVTNNLIYPYSFIATGLNAVVVQHEIDHLNGILFTDKIIPKIVKKKIGPNDLCPCNSGKKYKKCPCH
jgi:peptide deformylase